VLQCEFSFAFAFAFAFAFSFSFAFAFAFAFTFAFTFAFAAGAGVCDAAESSAAVVVVVAGPARKYRLTPLNDEAAQRSSKHKEEECTAGGETRDRTNHTPNMPQAPHARSLQHLWRRVSQCVPMC
jgi:hypothetical protein